MYAVMRLGVTCDDITLQNIILTPNPYLNSFGSVVTFSCISHHQFADADDVDVVTHRIARCDETGQWSPPLVDCVGMFTAKYRHIMLIVNVRYEINVKSPA